MSEQHDGGGPAFVIPAGGAFDNGMTLLDHFAGQALVGLLAYSPTDDSLGYFGECEGLEKAQVKRMAADCYLLAEAMVAEKRRREGGATCSTTVSRSVN